LKEGIPVRDSVRVGEYRYYVFNLYRTTNITSIFFQVTPINGDPDLFISRDIQTPGFQGFEKAACFCVNLIEYMSTELFTEKDSRNNTFYIATYGLTNADYTINVIIERNSTDDNGEIILEKPTQLFNHLPQKSVFKDTESMAFFDIILPSLDEKKNII